MACSKTCSEIRNAASNYTTFYILNHGAEELIENMFALGKQFFDLPLEKRMQVAARSQLGGGYRAQRASTDVFVATMCHEQTVITESYVGKNQWPPYPVGFSEAVQDYCDAMHRIALKIFSAIAMDRGLEASYFEPFVHSVNQSFHIRRYDYTHSVQRNSQDMLLNAHVDPPPVGFVVQNNVAGLETLINGQWVPLQPIPNTLICQFGMVMSHWTNDCYPATMHRVRAIQPEDNIDRYSMVYGIIPRFDATIECLPGFCSQDRPARYRSRSATEYFTDWIDKEKADSSPTSKASTVISTTKSEKDELLDEAIVANIRSRILAVTKGTWFLAAAKRIDNGNICMEFDVSTCRFILEMTAAQRATSYYKVHKSIAFWYRGHLRDPVKIDLLNQTILVLAEDVEPLLK